MQRYLGVDDALSFLVGAWATERRLLDRASGLSGTFSGLTTFTPDADGLAWVEEGTVSWPHFRGPAWRSYWISAVGGTTIVHFPDDRVLCRLDLRTGRARDVHACFPDTYRVDFAIHTADSVEYSWDVTGPAKDQLLSTSLRRA
ncbi:hypothetical protein E8P82_08535 [Arthrobacter echini]|uniref:DUF6314 domain-containing protein n=1 Tax=Arthrobacter echini TaxID=1529066 RepID=A0A4S5E4S2_9MICC|nr:DUF6314 family protein [Arthrobacter echini]THJ66496.1 hypothetical protein E8P82_08535 [Arthrobacter echini]